MFGTLKKVAIGLAAVLIALAAIGFLLPAQWRVERSVTIEAPPDAVYAIVSSLRTWPEWTSWSKDLDPSATWEFEGPEAGTGAMMKWKGPAAGAGVLTIAESEPGRAIRYTMRMEEDAFMARGALTLEPSGGGTRVTWVDEGDLGMNPMVRYFGLAMDSSMGRELQKGLDNLKRRAEAGRAGVP